MSSEKKKSKSIIIIWVLFTLGCVSALTNSFTQGSKAGSKVPLFGLSFQNHLLIFSFLWPLLMSIVCILLFPLIGIPILLKLKGKVWIKYKNGFLEIGKQQFDGKKFLRRIIYLFLLTLGVNAAILGLGMFDPKLLLPGEIYYETEIQGQGYKKFPLYYPDTFIGFASIIFPLMVGLWAIGWVLEDTGLMHFKLPKENETFLYEIEPIYLKYNSFVKGYAGISSILYLVTAIIFYITFDLVNVMFQVIGQIIMLMFFIVPAYFIHMLLTERFHKKIFRKGMQEVPMITQETYFKN